MLRPSFAWKSPARPTGSHPLPEAGLPYANAARGTTVRTLMANRAFVKCLPAGLFSSRFSPRFLSLRPLPPSRGGEGWDGGEKHGLGTPPACTPTLALPLAQGEGKDRQARVRKLNGPALGLLGPLGYARHHTEHSLP